MKKKKGYSSIHDIKITKERLRYEIMLYEEKLKNSNYLLFSGIAMSLRNFKYHVRNRMFSFALFRTMYKSKYAFDFARNFIRGLRRSG